MISAPQIKVPGSICREGGK